MTFRSVDNFTNKLFGSWTTCAINQMPIVGVELGIDSRLQIPDFSSDCMCFITPDEKANKAALVVSSVLPLIPHEVPVTHE